MLVDHLTWAGDGVGGKKTTRFQPRAIMTKGFNASMDSCWWTEDMPTGYVKEGSDTAFLTNIIDSVDATGFTTGSDFRVENSGVRVDAIVLGYDTGQREITLVTYAGDDAAQRNISCGFNDTSLAPACVVHWADGAGVPKVHLANMPEGDGVNNTSQYNSSSGLADRIYEVGANYFAVDDTLLSVMNATGTTYYAFCISESPKDRSFAYFSFVGDGVTTSGAHRVHTLDEPVTPAHVSVLSAVDYAFYAFAGSGANDGDGNHYRQGLGTVGVSLIDQDLACALRGRTSTGWAATINTSGRAYYGYVFGASALASPTAPVAARGAQGKLGIHTERRYAELQRSAGAGRDSILLARPGKAVTGFVLDQQGTYVSGIEETWGYPRDVVAVRTSKYPELTRVETLAECYATQGTYYYDVDAIDDADARSWDDGLDWWDEQLLDSGIAAYWELESSSDLEQTGVITTAFTEAGSPTYQAGLNDNGLLMANSTIVSLTDANTNSAFDWGMEDLAFHLKFKRSNSGVTAVLMRKLSGSDGFDLRITSGNVLQLFVGNGASLDSITGTTTITSVVDWQSVSVFRVQGTFYVYLNGQLEMSGRMVGNLDNGGSFQFGIGSGQTFVGMLDQPVFHNRSALFITQAYSGAPARTTLLDGVVYAQVLEMDGDANDAVGRSNFTEVLSPTYGTGVLGQGCQFTLVTDRTDSPRLDYTPTGGNIDPGSGSFVVAGKFKLDSGDGRAQYFYDQRQGTLTTNISVYRDASNNVLFYLEDDSGNISSLASSGTVTADGKWHSFVAVCDRSDDSLALYVDGAAAGTGSLTGTPGTFSGFTAAHCGAGFSGAGFNLDGRLDQMVFLHGRTWDATDVLEYHAAASGAEPGGWQRGEPRLLTVLEDAALVYHSNTAGSAALARTPIPSGNTDSWDEGTGLLYVHLQDDEDVSATSVFAHLGFHYATRHQFHPTLGTELLDSDAFPTGWSAVSWGDGTAIVQSLSAFQLHGTGTVGNTQLSGGGGEAYYEKEVTGRVSGALYRFAAYYLDTSPKTGDPWYPALAIVAPDGGIIDARGRDVGDEAVTCPWGNLVYRLAVFDFIAPATSFKLRLGVWAVTGDLNTNANVTWDQPSLRRIYRFEQYEPRLGRQSLPRVRIGARDHFFGQAKVSSGRAQLLIADGDMDDELGGLTWLNKEVEARIGGRFAGGEALSLTGMRDAFLANIRSLKADDKTVELQLQDARATISRKLPPRQYSAFTQASLDPDLDSERRPIAFGPITNATPKRIALDDDGKPTYELCDPTDTDGIKTISAVYAYLNSNAASSKDSTQRVTLVDGTDYSKDLTTAQITLLRDVGPIEIDETNDTIDFNDGSAQQATLTRALYSSWAALAAHIQTQMDAQSTDTITCTYSETTHKLTMASSGGTFSLLTSSGSGKDNAPWRLLGYETGSDKTGATSYEADDVVYEEDPSVFILRVDFTGYKDDSAGTFTGTASAAIQKGIDILAFLWVRYMKRPLSLFDSALRTAARTDAPQTLAVYHDDEVTTQEIFDRLEASNNATIVIDGAGRVAYVVRNNDTPTASLEDRDFLGYEEGVDVADTHSSVVVEFAEDPTTGKWQNRSVTTDGADLAVREDERIFETYLTDGENAALLAKQYGVLAAAAPRTLTVAARGLLDEIRVGEKVLVTRARSPLAPTGANASEVYVVRETETPLLEPGLSRAELVEDVTIPTS